MKKTLIYIVVFLNVFRSYSQLDDTDETITTDIEFETTDFSPQFYNGGNLNTPITSYKGNTYFMYLDSLRRPIIGKIPKDGKVITSRLDNDDIDPYYVHNDGHHQFSIGIDKEGYIHIVGDMHQYGAESSINYVDRYRNRNDHTGAIDNPNGSHILYWVSDTPVDSTNSTGIPTFTHMGRNEKRKIPGNGFSYPSYYNDMNGELYVQHRAKVSGRGHYDGEMGWVVAKYDTNTQEWKEIGGYSPSDGFPNNYETLYKSIFWEDNGAFGDTNPRRHWYQGFSGDMRFDFNNRWHFATSINNINGINTMTDVIYTYSDDGGVTFNKADGTSINELPARVEVGPNQASIVSDATDSPFGYHIWSSVSTDKEGTPVINYTKVRPNEEVNSFNRFFNGTYKYWDEDNNTWTEEVEYPSGGFHDQITLLDANGIVSYIGAGPDGVVTRDFGLASYITTQYSHFNTTLNGHFSYFDKKGIMEENVIRGFYYNPKEDVPTLKIMALKGTPKSFSPISNEWATTAIGNSSGENKMYQDIYQLKSTGTFGENLSGQYVNQSVEGDFELIARVINVDYISDDSFAGIMVKDNNEDDSSFFGVAVTSYEGVKTISEDKHGFREVQTEGFEPSEWLRITKKGHLLESFRSDNGKEWTKLDSRPIGMTTTVNYGLVSGSGNAKDQGYARVDHVSLNNLNLIANYEFDNNVLDVSGNDLHGTDSESHNYTLDNENQSLSLNGTNSRVFVNSNPLLLAENISASLWIKPNENNTGTRGVVKSVNANGYNNGWRIITNGNNAVARITTDQGSKSIGSFKLIKNQWNHVAFTYDKKNFTIYVNGVAFSESIALSGNIKYSSSSNVMEIGHTSGTQFFSGEIDDLRIYDVALSRNNINKVYNDSPLLSNLSAKASFNLEQKDILTSTSIYPNPIIDGIMNIEFTDFKGGENLQIIDTSGRILITEKLKGIQSTFDVSNLESNIYFVKILSAKETIVVKKILVQ